MECHKCEYREAVEAGKYAGVPYAETPCSRCNLQEVSLLTMAEDRDRPAFVPGKDGPQEATCEMVPFPEEVEAVDGKLPVGVMTEFIARLLALPPEVRDVVCWRFTGVTYPEIGRIQGITSAGAEARHERALRLFPELRKLFGRKIAKQKLRRRAGELSGGIPCKCAVSDRGFRA